MIDLKFIGLDSNQVDRITSAGIELMSAITDGIGSDKGIAVWDEFSSALGDDFKHAIFCAMLNGHQSGSILVGRGKVDDTTALVALIKAIRKYTGWGLKEAKDFADSTYTCERTLKVASGSRSDAVREIRSTGATAN